MSAEKLISSKESCLASNVTPKRKTVSHLSMTPLCSINEESHAENVVKKTPNPFDVKAESLYFSACSPFFATLSRNKKKDGTFRWSIDQLSVLYPADIDESSLPPEVGVDPEQEIEAQKAIDVFFSQKSIVPSPWSDSPANTDKKETRLRRASQMVYNIRNNPGCDAATQTALSIPPAVDLEAILGDYFAFNNDESFTSRDSSQEESDSLSTSCLRRKLFQTEEECTSPSKLENKNLYNAKLWSTPSAKRHSAHSTPSSDVLSSSPITPPNCSDSCNILSSPPVSPIAADVFSPSVHMKSFNAQDGFTDSSDIYYSPDDNPANFLAHKQEISFSESQKSNPFPSYRSEKQDTGYVTGSISSSQNMNFSEGNYGLVSRISPVMEMMEECELSKSAVCNMSYTNDCPSGETSLFFGSNKPLPSTSGTYPWMPTYASTPAPGLSDS